MPRPDIAPDLDQRPGEPARSTLGQWIQLCRSCGAAAPDLARLPADAADVVRSEAYARCPGSEVTRPFRRWAMLCPPDERPDFLLHAAWAAGDAGLAEEAAALRRDVAEAWADTRDIRTICRRLDVLRRAELFEAAHACLKDMQPLAGDEGAAAILAFQRARIAARDTGRHLMSAALRPSAHAPHVSHGKRTARGGWLSRVLGR